VFSVSTSGPPPAGFLAGVPDVLRLGGEGDLVRVRVRVGVDDAEDVGGSLAEPKHVEHVHVQPELFNSPTASTEGSTGVLASLTASRISAEAEAHPLGLTGKADEADGCGQQDNIFQGQHFLGGS